MAMNPEQVLARGYVCVRVDGKVISDGAALQSGQRIAIDMHASRVTASVERVEDRV